MNTRFLAVLAVVMVLVAASPALAGVPPSQVPDSGTTLVLLGAALVGLGALRRKFRG